MPSQTYSIQVLVNMAEMAPAQAAVKRGMKENIVRDYSSLARKTSSCVILRTEGSVHSNQSGDFSLIG